MKITIFGAGAYGTALGKILTSNGHEVKFYDPLKFPETNLSTAISDSEVNILCAPSTSISKLLFFMPKDRPLICATKGLISFAPFEAYGENFAVLSGGAFAKDLEAEKPTTLTATGKIVKDLFETSWLKFDETTDHLGVLLCGTLKNVYAIGAGLWLLEEGTKDFEDFIARATIEMQYFLALNNADPETIHLACGESDLRLTSSTITSRNYAFGKKLRTVPKLGADVIAGRARINSTVEGLNATILIKDTPSFRRPQAIDAPLFDYIFSAVTNTPLTPYPTEDPANVNTQ